jgi:chromate transporter
VLAGLATVVVLLAPQPWVPILVIVVGGLVGWRFLRGAAPAATADGGARAGPRRGVLLLVMFGALLVGLPIAVRLFHSDALAVTDAFYRSGALVFGGGHVVLPLLSDAVVTPGWVGEDRFLAGYGAVQAVPGPLFSFAGFLGASLRVGPSGVPGAILAVVAIFLPSFLLVWGTLPSWDRLRRSATFAAALRGTNAVVVGILLAALITPVASSALHGPLEVALAAVGFAVLWTGRAPPIAVVAGLAVAGQVLALG